MYTYVESVVVSLPFPWNHGNIIRMCSMKLKIYDPMRTDAITDFILEVTELSGGCYSVCSPEMSAHLSVVNDRESHAFLRSIEAEEKGKGLYTAGNKIFEFVYESGRVRRYFITRVMARYSTWESGQGIVTIYFHYNEVRDSWDD